LLQCISPLLADSDTLRQRSTSVAFRAKRTLDRASIGIANGQGAIVKNLGSRPLAAPAVPPRAICDDDDNNDL